MLRPTSSSPVQAISTTSGRRPSPGLSGRAGIDPAIGSARTISRSQFASALSEGGGYWLWDAKGARLSAFDQLAVPLSKCEGYAPAS